jgi:hypothetical protein
MSRLKRLGCRQRGLSTRESLVGRQQRDEVLLEPAGVVDDVAAGGEQT